MINVLFYPTATRRAGSINKGMFFNKKTNKTKKNFIDFKVYPFEKERVVLLVHDIVYNNRQENDEQTTAE